MVFRAHYPDIHDALSDLAVQFGTATYKVRGTGAGQMKTTAERKL